MDNQETDKLNIATKNKLGVVQIKNSATINNLDNVKITKVLTATAKPMIENITVANAEVKFDGVVEYNLLVALENNNIVPLTQKSSFSQVFENSNISADSTVVILPTLIELNNLSNGDDIMLSSLVNFDVVLIGSNTDVTCAGEIDGVFTKEGETSYSSLVGKTDYDFEVGFDIKKDSKTSNILFSNSFATIKSIIPSNDYFVVSGEVNTVVVFSDSDGEIKSLSNTSSFSEEVESMGVNKDSIIQAEVLTRETVVVENSENAMITLTVPLRISAKIFSTFNTKCIVDAYSLQNEIKLTTTSFDQDEFFTTRQIEDTILTNFALEDASQPVDKILSYIPTNLSLVNQIVKDEELTLEGIATINVIYYFQDDDGNNNLNSIDVDIPYSLNLTLPELKLDDKVEAGITFGDINIKNKRGKELEILVEVKVNYNLARPAVSAVVSQIVMGEEKPQKDYSLEIYIANENQTLWDIAKELNVSTPDLIAQNGELSMPLSNGEKIISYRQRTVDFD